MLLQQVVLAAALTASLGRGAVLLSTQALEIRFNTVGISCPHGACDVMLVSPVHHGSWDVYGGDWTLFNGRALLGTFASPFCCVAGFRSAASLASTHNTTIDFNSLVDGTIDEIVYLKLGTGFFTWPGAPEVSVGLFHTQALGFFEGYGPATVTSVRIVDAIPEPSVPEPSTALLVGAAIVTAGLSRSVRGARGMWGGARQPACGG